MTTYRYATLDPRPTLEAQAHNDAIIGDGSTILGIEVTVPALAARCGLGNIDPQHIDGDAGTAAIESAMTCPLPLSGATLVTVRADADSVGAMALLTHRRRHLDGVHRDGTGDYHLVADRIRAGVALIAEGDKEASGPWPGPRPIGSPPALVSEFGVVSAVAMDYTLPLDERVAELGRYLATGLPTSGMVANERRLLIEAEAAMAGLRVRLDETEQVVTVVGTHRLAMSLGYRFAPVVVAGNPEFRFNGGSPHRKWTVARWNSDYPMDWDGLKAALNEREPGWGGSTSIMGSPQGAHSSLEGDELVDLVVKHLTWPVTHHA